MANRYGKENVVSAYVHLDETAPHIHFSFIPITKDKKKGGFKELNAIEGKKSIGGALKNVMFEEWLSVKATAEHVDEVTAENKQLKADLEKEKQNFAKTTAEIRKSHQQEIASLKEENRKLNNRVLLQSQAARRLNLEEPLNKAAREIFEELRQKREIKNTSRSGGRR